LSGLPRMAASIQSQISKLSAKALRLQKRAQDRSPRTLQQWRGIINGLDEILLVALAARCAAAESIAGTKIQKHLPVEDPARQKQQLQTRRKSAKKLKLPEEWIESLWNLIISESKALQSRIKVKRG
jgi:chorismate mutase